MRAYSTDPREKTQPPWNAPFSPTFCYPATKFNERITSFPLINVSPTQSPTGPTLVQIKHVERHGGRTGAARRGARFSRYLGFRAASAQALCTWLIRENKGRVRFRCVAGMIPANGPVKRPGSIGSLWGESSPKPAPPPQWTRLSYSKIGGQRRHTVTDAAGPYQDPRGECLTNAPGLPLEDRDGDNNYFPLQMLLCHCY